MLFLYRFNRIGKYGYFQKLEEKMAYNEGQKACSKLYGHIVEFDERVPNYGKFYHLKAQIKKKKKLELH